MIFNLGSNKVDNKDNSSRQIYCLQNSLLMSIVDTPKKGLSNVEDKYDTRKVHTSSLKPS